MNTCNMLYNHNLIPQSTQSFSLKDKISSILSYIPPIDEIVLNGEPDYYGASYIISRKIGLKFTLKSNANWIHGWYRLPFIHPKLIITNTPKQYNLVAKEEHALFLERNGFKAQAIGVPFVYVDDADVQKIPNSVLIMPSHSTTHVVHNNSTEKFANDIRLLNKKFGFVVACLSGMCVKHKNWTDYFERLDIPWVTGAWIYDSNALVRMNAILRSFEYVATNSFGSHIAYAAYCGCKVFTLGDMYKRDPKLMLNEPFYKNNPELIPFVIKYNSERYLRDKYPYFFNGVNGARDMTEWAKNELGEANKRDPRVVAELLGWDIQSKLITENENTTSSRILKNDNHVKSDIGISANQKSSLQMDSSKNMRNAINSGKQSMKYFGINDYSKNISIFLRTMNRLVDMLNSNPDRTSMDSQLQPVIEEGLRLGMKVLAEGRPEIGLTLVARLKALRLPLMGLDDLRARCFLAMNRLEDAREAFKEELRFFPGNSAAKAGLNELPASRITERNSAEPHEFSEILSIVRPYTMLSKKRLQSLYDLVLSVCDEDLPGAFVECGVAAGGSSALMAAVMKKHSRRRRFLYSFDSFEGMPTPGEHDCHGGVAADSTGWGTGTCASPVSSLQQVVSDVNANDVVVPVKGYFNQTLPLLSPVMGPIALLHMDGDWYESTRDILHNLWHRVVPRGWIQVDDYGFWEGCRKAIEEFFAEHRLDLPLERIDETGVRFRKP